MNFFPTDKKKLKARIGAYKRALAKPNCDDGYGKRFLVGHMYLLLGDHDGALQFYDWYTKKFPEDGVEPLNHVTWALASYRSGKIEDAQRKLKEAATRNPHIWDWLRGDSMDRWDIEYGCNFDEPEYLHEAPPEILELWTPEELNWVCEYSMTEEVVSLMAELTSIRRELKGLRPGPRRTAVCERLFELQSSVSPKRQKGRKLSLVK
ncbi:MAG: tetratricopeptide repeat protein [Bdellovibrionia bacterium]